MTPLDILSNRDYWTSQHEIVARTLVVRPELVPTLLRKLEERKLAVSRSDDEGGRVYKLTLAGTCHAEKARQRRISSFPPPRMSWPPVKDCA